MPRRRSHVEDAQLLWDIGGAGGMASDLALGAIRPPSHRNIMTASPDCAPFSWMMPSTVRSAFVFSWIKVSVPLVKCLSPY